MAQKKPDPNPCIANNKKASYNDFLEERFEAGVELQGWEMKTASTYVTPESQRTRKLLMHKAGGRSSAP